MTAGRIHILPASPCASLDLVPIDHVIGGLTDIAEQMAAASGGTYHLVSDAPVPVAALRTLALGYPHLHPPRFVPLIADGLAKDAAASPGSRTHQAGNATEARNDFRWRGGTLMISRPTRPSRTAASLAAIASTCRDKLMTI